jgi:hypothetical protein
MKPVTATRVVELGCLQEQVLVVHRQEEEEEEVVVVVG